MTLVFLLIVREAVSRVDKFEGIVHGFGSPNSVERDMVVA
jgi:hypothetical protein